ncbi:MAG: hypothetical protein CME65_07680 [Halobacteriovoraceae bacterium]|nr:hypothetical protein [Halobacteriovoraceae bacterium]|tara:strand:- start:4346 stop:5410 length:1065 start_codon:yes stop_codon:yes gene_type:complete
MIKGIGLSSLLISALFSTSAFAIRNGVSGRHFSEKNYTVEFSIDRGRDIEGVCSGVRIHQNYALTAAHCFEGVSSTRSFETKYYDSRGRRREVNPTISDVIIFDTVLERELALVPLGNPTDDFTPPVIFKGNYTPSTIRFYGYGMRRSGTFGGLQTATLNWAHVLSNSRGRFIVTSPGIGDAHPCPGDSGGPLFKEVDGEQHLAGIISFVRKSDGIMGDDRERVCRQADRAFFIPLQDHLDFLETYFEVATTPQPEPVISVIAEPTAEDLEPVSVASPVEVIESEEVIEPELAPETEEATEPEVPAESEEATELEKPVDTEDDQEETESVEEDEATNLAENETSPSSEPVLTEE